MSGTLPACGPDDTPLEFLLSVMRDGKIDGRARIEAAKAAAPYMHKRATKDDRAPLTKAGERTQRADTAAKGKYAPGEPPKLVVSNPK